jgi:hypothetical protein
VANSEDLVLAVATQAVVLQVTGALTLPTVEAAALTTQVPIRITNPEFKQVMV